MTSLIIGNKLDLHVQAVTSSMAAQDCGPAVLVDVESLAQGTFTLTTSELEIEGQRVNLRVPEKGWLRRYAPSKWGAGVASGSQEAAINRSYLSLVGSVARLGHREWLTTLEAMLRAEDRLVQLEVAASLNIFIPKSIVTSSAERAIDELGDRFIVKPVSLAYFETSSGPMAVYTNEIDSRTALGLNFGEVPFVAQEIIEVEKHLRVVTVQDTAWVAQLSASGRPIDWRQQESAHHEWQVTTNDDCERDALRLASEFGLGFSSQDWLMRGRDLFFIDLNPGGQWLFLPEEISTGVTASIAKFLAEV